jgi:putative phosphonate catabolism associated alcohol dehydrogenase
MPISEAAVFTVTGQAIEVKEFPIPVLQSGELLVRNEYVTLCRSDLNTYCGRRIEPSPTILGHEIVGRIEAFGPDAIQQDLRGDTLKSGDRISWAIYSSDPTSELSKRGIPQKGANLYKYGHEKITTENILHGGLSQYIILRPHTPILKIAEHIPVQVAAIINCAVATMAGAIRTAGNLQNQHVLIVGAGMLGMIGCAMSKTLGAASVTALDLNPARLEQAGKYGADHALLSDETLPQHLENRFGKSNPFNVIIEITGSPDSAERALSLLTIGGTLVLIGATFPERNIQFSGEKMVRNLWSIKGLHNYNETDFLTAATFIEQHHSKFPFTEMIHDKFSLKQVNEAFEYGLHSNPFRVGIKIE